MNKIPVFATIGGAYRFAFGRFFGNLGVVWMPAALLLLGAWYLIPLYAATFSTMISAAGGKPDPVLVFAGIQNLYRFVILFWIGVVLMRAEMMLGLTRRALGLATGPSFVFLSLAKPFWRLSGAYFAVMIILWVVETVLIAVLVVIALITGGTAILSMGSDKAALAPFAVVAAIIGIAAVLCALFYIAVRLTFLLTPVIVAEERFDLIRPWRLGGGNFWRIFAVGVSTFVPILILIGAVSVPLYFSVLWPLPHLPTASHDPQEAARNVHALFAWLFGRARTHWFLIAPIPILSSTLLYGVAAGAAASAYRALVPSAPLPPRTVNAGEAAG